MRMRVGWIASVLVLLVASCVSAQTTITLSEPPIAPVTICVKQNLPAAASWTVSMDGGAAQSVALTTPANAAKCAAGDSHSYTLPSAGFTAGTHTLRMTAVKGTKTKQGPLTTVIVEDPEPGEPVITNVVPEAVVGGGTTPLANFVLGPGSTTFGLALPQGAATSGLRLGALTTQADIKTRWSDGSIRFAIVSAQIPSSGAYAVTAGSATTSGAVTPTWPNVSVTFTISGSAWVAALPAFNGADTWLAGPVVRESRVMVTPRLGTTDHPLLQVIYDIRSYASGGHRVDVTVQNVRDITAGNSVDYDVSVSIGGQAVFVRTGVKQAYLTRWRKVFTTGGLVEAQVTPDVEPFYLSRAIPRFHPQVVNQAYSLPADAPCQPEPAKCFDILRYGDLPSYMGMPGGRADLAPYPNWTVQYLVHKQPAARAWMLKHADLSGSYTGHITKADGRFVTLDEMPNYWLDGRAGTNPNGPNATRKADGFLQGWGDGLETAHMPSLTFVPFLLTGDRFYLDQQKHWANFALLATWPGDGWRSSGGAKGILYQNQPRGFGWGLRVIGELAAYLPDADPDRAYFRARVDENVAFLDRQPIDDPGGPLGVPFVRGFGQDGERYAATSMWQVSYVAYAVDRLRQLGWTPGAAFLKQAAAFQVKLFTSAPDFPPIYGAPYYPKVGRWTGTGASAVVTEWFSMSQIYATNYKSGAEPPQPFTGYYGPETRILLLIAKAQGIPKADEALTFLSSQPGVMSDIYGRSGWAIASVGK
jgi:hypothetical protein